MNNEVEDTNNDNSTKNVTSGQSKKIWLTLKIV